MAVTREVKEGKQYQGNNESVAYTITTTPWGSSPANVAVSLWDITTATEADVSATKLSGAASVVGDVITTPLVAGLTVGSTYRMQVKFTTGGNTLEPYVIIEAQK